MKRTYTVTAILALFFLGCSVSKSCANTTTPPGGGPKDTIPPVLIKVIPENSSTEFPIFDGKVIMLYDEYTIVKNPQEIVVSPPVKKKPVTKIKGKNIVVTFQDSLMTGRTYTIDFGASLADNNEGNIAPRMVYTFSTGTTVDSMYICGNIIDCKTLAPVKGALVTLYSDLSDSACFLTLPDAAAKTDDWGFFSIRNIKDTTYRVYAYTDKNADYKYNPDEDLVAFLDTLFTTTQYVNDSIKELQYCDPKDTAACTSRKPMITMKMFQELQSVQYLQNSGRSSEKKGYLKFSAADVRINSMDFLGIDSTCVITQFNKTRDSLDFWINVDYRLEDSLMLRLNYMKTDSTGKLSEAIENLSLTVNTTDTENSEEKKGERDTVFALSINGSGETVDNEGISVFSEQPVLRFVIDSIHLIEKNPKGQLSAKGFRFERDTEEIRRFHIIPEEKLIKGYEYEIQFPQGTFINIDGLPNKADKKNFSIPQDEKLCTLTLNISGVSVSCILELTDENGKAIRTFRTDKDYTIDIPYLNAGKYMIRLTSDVNKNGFADTGNLLDKKQPEEVRFYESSPGNQILELPESAEVEQNINLATVFE